MKQIWILAIFVAVALIQLAVPAHTIWRQERILAAGAAFRFRTAPVDPNDAFRGRFVALSFRDVFPLALEGATPEPGKPVYVAVAEGADGYAVLSEAFAAPPAGKPYVRATWDYAGGVTLPFDRFYLDEDKAPEAESAYRKEARQDNSYLLVRILDGGWAIENLYVGGKPLAEAVGEAR